jgi:hypothetical protein
VFLSVGFRGWSKMELQNRFSGIIGGLFPKAEVARKEIMLALMLILNMGDDTL